MSPLSLTIETSEPTDNKPDCKSHSIIFLLIFLSFTRESSYCIFLADTVISISRRIQPHELAYSYNACMHPDGRWTVPT